MTRQPAGLKQRLLACGSAALLCFVAAGCSTSGTLTGKITYDGVPLRGGIVTFRTQDGKARITARIQPDGTYTAEDVELGPNIVTVDTRPARNEQSAGLSHARYVPIPGDYQNPNSSNLRVTVWGGPQTYDIELK